MKRLGEIDLESDGELFLLLTNYLGNIMRGSQIIIPLLSSALIKQTFETGLKA